MSHDPEFLLSLRLIPTHLLRYLPEKIPPPDGTQKGSIRQILNMRKEAKFNRCRFRSKARMKLFERSGDYSHSAPGHVCEQCRCKSSAGMGTRGDFYGLGVETGHLGVGPCANCQRSHHIRPGLIIRNADTEVRLLQQYGVAEMTGEYAEELATREAGLAIRDEKVRADMELVVDELEKFKKMTDKENPDFAAPTEYVMGQLADASDMTILNAKLDIAKTLSKIRGDAFKLSEDQYIHVNELLKRAPAVQNAVRDVLQLVEEMVIAKHVRGVDTDIVKTPTEHAFDLFVQKWKSIFSDMKTGRRSNK